MGQGMSRGAECSHAAAVALQRRGQSSRRWPPFSGHDQHQRLRSIQGNAPSSLDHNQLGHLIPSVLENNGHSSQFAQFLGN
jgi:hypothetical protein